MILDGYTLTSNDMIGKYQLTPDDGECDLCGEPGPIYHIVDRDFISPGQTMFGVTLRTERNILDICEHCCLQLAAMFREGTES